MEIDDFVTSYRIVNLKHYKKGHQNLVPFFTVKLWKYKIKTLNPYFLRFP